MIRLLMAMVLTAYALVGCSGARSAGDGGPLGKIVDANAGASEAERSMWPFAAAGFLCLLGGAAYFIFMKNAKLLMIGAGIALVPPLFFLFMKPLVPYVGIMALLAGLAMLGHLGWTLYDKIADGIRENRRARKSGSP